MGVINITPNSFSDGGKHFDVEACLQKLIEFSDSTTIIDVGAESTAPMNESISFDDEFERFKTIFIPALVQFHDLRGFFPKLSFDTYKLKTIQSLAEETKKIGIDHFIWNDVSGIIDQDVVNFLISNKEIDYVFCHNQVPSRDLTSKHKNFANQNLDIEAVVLKRFREVIDIFKNNNLSNRLYLDPCFGFAKTRDQNHQLIRALPQIIQKIPNQKWILGISKKSFLSFSQNFQNKDDFFYREMVHFSILRHWLKIFSDEKILYRVHDPSLVELADQTKNLF